MTSSRVFLNKWNSLRQALDPVYYLQQVGFDPFDWQRETLKPDLRRVLLLCARQSGKSTIVGGKTRHCAKSDQGSLSLIIAPAQDQSKELMKKIEAFLYIDGDHPDVANNTFEKEWSNGSRIIALPGSERSVRGYSGPRTILIDEAARVLDETYRATRPMMVGADTTMIAMTTPFGKRGWFWKAWESSRSWHKILVRVAWDVDGGRLVPAMPEAEFRDVWAKRGVSAYYSPRHDLRFLEEELDEIGEHAFRQEYCCEFLDTGYSAFDTDLILNMFGRGIEPIVTEQGISPKVQVLEV